MNQRMFPSPSKLLRQFLSHPLASNITWLLGEKGLRLGITFFMGIWVARYLGPEKFGLLSYAIAFTSLFSPLVRLGLDAIVVRDIVSNLDRPDICIGSAMVLRFIGASFMFIVVIACQFILEPSDQKMLIMVAIMVTGYFFRTICHIGPLVSIPSSFQIPGNCPNHSLNFKRFYKSSLNHYRWRANQYCCGNFNLFSQWLRPPFSMSIADTAEKFPIFDSIRPSLSVSLGTRGPSCFKACLSWHICGLIKLC